MAMVSRVSSCRLAPPLASSAKAGRAWRLCSWDSLGWQLMRGSIVYALTQVLNVCDTLPCLHDGSRCHLPAATRGAGLLRTGLAAAQPPLFRCVAAGTASQSLSAQKLRAN